MCVFFPVPPSAAAVFKAPHSLKSGNMSPNPTIRASHAHLHLPLSFPPGCIQAPRFCVCLYLAHPHSHMRLHNHIVSRKAAGESKRGGRRWRVTGMRFSSNLVPRSPQLPRKKQGGQVQVAVRLRAHLAADRSGRFTGCTFVRFWLTAPDLLFVCVCARCKIEPNLIPLPPCSNLLSLKHKSAKEKGKRNNPLKDHMHGHHMLNCLQQNMCGIIYCVTQGIFPARFDSDLSDVWPCSQLRLLTSAVLSKLAK